MKFEIILFSNGKIQLIGISENKLSTDLFNSFIFSSKIEKKIDEVIKQNQSNPEGHK